MFLYGVAYSAQEFSRKEIKAYEKQFKDYDTGLYKFHCVMVGIDECLGRDGFIDLQELKYMMEKLGAPQVK